MVRQHKQRCTKKIIGSEQLALRQLRLDLQLTLTEAGKKINLTDKGLGAIENGRVDLKRSRIEQIIKAYGLEYLDFIRAKRIIERNQHKKCKRETVKTVLTNKDRRSYQKKITKECRVLKSLRRQKGITQDNASFLCGYSRPTIGHIENGRIELPPERIKHILECYGLKYSDFE